MVPILNEIGTDCTCVGVRVCYDDDDGLCHGD
jgi:hypothetical protein